MDRKQVSELERLLSELADEGATQNRVKKIEDMLKDNPELQDSYWSWMDIHTGLGTERNAILGSSNVTSASATSSDGKSSPISLLAASRVLRNSRRVLVLAIALAACLAWMMLADSEFFWNQNGDQFGSHMASTAESGAWQIPRITRVSWEGPFFSDTEPKPHTTTSVRTGMVSLGLVDGPSANGYVLRLGPGEHAELLMSADASTENNLSVIELGSTGVPTHRSVSFNNFGAGANPEHSNKGMGGSRYGLMGTWSVYNDTLNPKYYLLSGIHKLVDLNGPDSDLQDEFRLSDMVVLVDTSDLIVIGYDDGGIEATERTDGRRADRDYDDITVVIRILGPNTPIVKTTEDCRILASWPSSDLEMPATSDSGRYQITLVPGEFAVLKMASAAVLKNALFLVNDESSEVYWSTENKSRGMMDLGAVAVQNPGPGKMKLSLVGLNSDPLKEKGKWQESKLSILHEQPSCAILGYDDQELGTDFDDIRVTLFTLPPDRNILIEKQQ